MRQRRALHRGAAVCAGAAARPRARHGEQGGVGARARAAGRSGVGGHGRARISIRASLADGCAGRSGRATRSRSAARASSSARCRSAIRTQCCASRTSTAAPVARLGPAIERHPRFPRRANVGFMQVVGPRPHSHCGCSSAAWARLWPAARALARPWRWAGAKDCSRRTCGSICRAAPRRFLGRGPGEHVWLTGPAMTVFSGIDRHLTRHHRELEQ